MSILSINNVSKSYGSGSSKVDVLKNINLEVENGEFLAIVGFSGSGKTTLMQMLAGLVQPDRGEIIFKGEKVTGPSAERGMIFQNYSLLPWLTVYENVALSVNAIYKDKSKVIKDRIIRESVEMVNLTPAINKKPKELSGGMRQRVSVARALAVDPELLLMDEPLSALDALTRGNLQDEILNIWSKNKRTAILITNDVDEGILMADRIIPLDPGPNATFGPEFKIDLERPRDKTAMNHDPRFKQIRNNIIEYLMDIGEGRKSTETEEFILPDLQPIIKGSSLKKVA
ncbi:ABC transporter ATP-binding protein [Jiulongibacter sediminis]|uniref:Nitrate ABC transporter ATP-binding protein n=1 Tax=Jiulongibacter sediminis TaxID=1605367 RepID=A0A0P7BLV9_9BACT|nr:ABC transporter ATP-binding protein [Jiulongibacter sediminis]KPM48233.1 nitrate ABC transporter ATP-binding protein [Jiulongibacter sediminis]TBX24776.1 nitrate ABC transporter ATP-binding protein [Jiulongibacter sediminis]